jgi:hypothetical protein
VSARERITGCLMDGHPLDQTAEAAVVRIELKTSPPRAVTEIRRRRSLQVNDAASCRVGYGVGAASRIKLVKK